MPSQDHSITPSGWQHLGLTARDVTQGSQGHVATAVKWAPFV